MPLPTVVKRITHEPPLDASAYLEELDLPEATREVIRRGWPWYMIELGGGIRTVSAQMLDERTDADLLKIPGMSRRHLRVVRSAVAKDPGVISHLFPDVSREESRLARGAFPEQVEQVFGPDGRPLRPETEGARRADGDGPTG